MDDQNLTWDEFLLDGEEFSNINDDGLDEYIDYEVMATFEKCFFPILVVAGLFLNITALVVLIRRRLWLHHEVYVYLVAILVNDSVQLGAVYVPWWLALFHDTLHIAYSSEVVCKFWILLTRLVQSTGWFHIAILCNVYVRLRLKTNERGTTCSELCRKCCTLRGTMICVALLFCASVIVNLWYFVSATVHHFAGEVRLCYAGDIFQWQNRYVKLGLNCLVNYIPVIVMTPVLVLMIAVLRRTRFGFAFGRLDTAGDAPSDDVDCEEVGKLSLWLALVQFVLRSPFHLVHMLDESRLFHSYRTYFALYAICLIHPVAVAIVCLAVPGRLRREAKAMAVMCWSFTLERCRRRRRASLPVAWSSGSTLVLQFDSNTLDVETDI